MHQLFLQIGRNDRIDVTGKQQSVAVSGQLIVNASDDSRIIKAL